MQADAAGLQIRKQCASQVVGFDLVDAADVIHDAGSAKYIVNGYIEDDSFVQLFGAPKSLKSFTAIDIGMSIASGTPWFGHEIKRSGLVVYICGEGHGGIGRRMKAWCQEKGVDPNT